MSLRLLMVSIVLTAGLAVPAAHAERPDAPSPAWVLGAPLSRADPDGVRAVASAALPGGRRAVAWATNVPADAERVYVRVEGRDGGFGQEQSFAGATTTVALAAGPHGTLALAWTDPIMNTVHLALRAPEGGPFSEVTPLKTVASLRPYHPAAAFLDDGAGHDVPYVAFSGEGNGLRTIWATRVATGDTALTVAPGSASGGALDLATNPGGTAPTTEFWPPSIAAGPKGVTVAYARRTSGGGQQGDSRVVEVRSADAGQSFAAPSALAIRATPAGGNPPYPAVEAAGGATGIQLLYGFYGETQLRLQRPDRTVAVDAGDGSLPDAPLLLGLDGDGDATLAWTGDGASGSAAYATRVPATGPAPAPQRLSPPGADRVPKALDVGPDGSATVVVGDDEADGALTLDTHLAPADGAFGPVERLPGSHVMRPNRGLEDAVTAWAGDRPSVAWVATDYDGPDTERVRIAERDVAPPTIAQADGPATATVGQRVAFAGVAFDDRTGAALRWDFGDGTFADGAAVEHVFAAPGTRTVVLTATDGAGHAVSRALAVDVAPRPPGPPPPPTTPPAAPPDRTAPVLAGLSLSRATFRAAGGATAIAAKTKAKKKKAKATPRGTTIRIRSLSERATLVITFTRKVGGRTRTEGTLVRAARGPGAVALPFSGRIGKAALPAAKYTMSVVAVDAAGNRAKNAETARLTIAAR